MNGQHPLPWGLTRSQPFPASTPGIATRVELDPVTQTGVHRDAVSGQILEAGKHGTNKETAKKQRTGGGGDGTAPPNPDETTVTDYDND